MQRICVYLYSTRHYGIGSSERDRLAFRPWGCELTLHLLPAAGKPEAFLAGVDGESGECSSEVGIGVSGLSSVNGQLHESAGGCPAIELPAS